MKQKVVIKIFSMNDTRSRRKAMEIAVSIPGVTSVELQGDEKNQIAIIGEGIDSTCLTIKIRKKVGYTEIVSITPIPAEKKPEEKKPDDEKKLTVQPIFHHPCQFETPPIFWKVIHDPNPDPCTIL
ncbi:Heavy metal-associated isoprenylated plant protein [Thalictrum thalictroides]|uniref:Heavy metal-associated isoprenylated plant protein n=1 Tax=Thalictrum thalictroides TaxID=46969 RepID=A0A7J6WZ80_THATH|nr:Heavy metal-associated isoprenylated plant protein [Thalictrum thalictroides]